MTFRTVGALLAAALACAQPGATQPGATRRVEVVFTGGHETDPRDHGRPDILIAAAMGVPTEVFREAFSHVTPAAGGRDPDPEQVRRNKAALLQYLSPYGLTNERIDEVSNYYRYSRGRGEQLWRNVPAAAYATVRDGRVESLTIENPGAGYSSEPLASVPGFPDLKIVVKLSFGKDPAKNGALESLSVAR